MSSPDFGPGAPIGETGITIERAVNAAELERQRLIGLVNFAVESYASSCLPVLRKKVRAGEDKGEIKLGEGKTFKLGDVELSIDPIGENSLHDIVDSLSLPAVIHGEHQEFPSPTGETLVHFEIDPFDNTSEYQAGLKTPPWTVLSAYDTEGQPMVSFIGDIRNNTAYMFQNGRLFEKDFETGEKREIKKSERKSILEDRSVLASYTGSSEYSTPFFREFSDLLEQRSDKALFYSEGGAFIYGPLASGAVDAYVMFDEPYEEIDPGAAIAIEAGCILGHYDIKKDKWIPYKYDPKKQEKVAKGIWIAASSVEIRNEIVEHYRGKHGLEPGTWDAEAA